MPPITLQKTPQNACLRVGFILSKNFTLTAFSSFIDVLRLSADEGDRSRQILCKWDVISHQQKPIPSSSGVSIFPDKPLDYPIDYDYLVVVGGLLDEKNELEPEYIEYLQAATRKKIPLIGLCTGGFILHRAGLMNGYRCCISWFHHDDFLYQFDGLVPVSDQIFVIDRDRLTCSGGTSSAHLAAHLVEKHIGVAQARKSLRILIVDDIEIGNRAQPGIPLELNTKDDLVQRALNIMQQNISTPMSIKNLADFLGVGRRKLERRFQDTLNMSPGDADKRIRLNHAKNLLDTTTQSISQVAMDVGFCNASHFIKTFRDYNTITPATYREHVSN